MGNNSAKTVWLSAAGSDENDGSARTKAFATFTAARDAVRNIRSARPFVPVTLNILPGIYNISETLRFSAKDSGMDGSPVVWKSVGGSGAGEVLLSGGRALNNPKKPEKSEFERLNREIADSVVCWDLSENGVNYSEGFMPRGFGHRAKAHTELFFRGKRQKISRWPKKGFLKIAGLTDVKDSFEEHEAVRESSKTEFIYPDDRPSGWKYPERALLHGYWGWDWADLYRTVKRIDPANHIIETLPSSSTCLHFRTGGRFCYLNVLEELSTPGEYVLDVEDGKIYTLPDGEFSKGDFTVSCLEQPLISLEGASHIKFEGISAAYTRSDGVTVDHCLNIGFDSCRIFAAGNTGISINGGAGVRIIGCEITGTGDGCVSVTGGSREHLIPCGHIVSGCRLHDFAEWSKTYMVGVYATGAGITVSGNKIYDAPHCAILYLGNDIIIEDNEIYRIALETHDVGAIYTGRDWTARGDHIRFNYIHDIGSSGNTTPLAIGIYLDDFHSGQFVYGNIVDNCAYGILIGGGRENLVDGNMLINCSVGFHLDARGTSWARNFFDGRFTQLFDTLETMKYAEPPYSVRYPSLLKIKDDEPQVPKYNSLTGNIFCGCEKWLQLFDNLDASVVEMSGNEVYESFSPEIKERMKSMRAYS